jgi:hypothetical protein
VDACLLCFNRYAHSSPFCAAFLPPHSLSLSNERCHVFHLVKQPNTAIIIIIIINPPLSFHHPSSSSLVLLLIHDLSLAVVCLNVVVHYCFRRLGRALYLWEQYFLYALPSSALITRTTHTFFRNFTRTHIFLPPAYLNVRNKQKGFRSRTACAASGPAAVDTDHLYDAAPRAATGRDCTHCTVTFFFLTFSYPLRSLRCRLLRRLESFLFLFRR